MSTTRQERIFQDLAGFPLEEAEIQEALETPLVVQLKRERLKAQVLEVITINASADAIETCLDDNGFDKPAVILILTAGMDVPEKATLLGRYGEEGAFHSFPQTDIYGHAGEVYAAKIGVKSDQTMLILKGRAHPYEWSKDEYGDMIVAHPLQVLKEIARRQRAENKIDPVFIFTYLTGVREGHSMKTGELGLILDDTPTDNDTHPGQGPRAILDEYLGPRFQPKDGRTSHLGAAAAFMRFLEQTEGHIYPTAAVGTPGTTEFQSSVEARLFDAAFEGAISDGNFGEIVTNLFGETNNASLLFCMGITEEVATMRQVFSGEDDFKVLAFGLATDAVGGKQSKEIDHQEVVATASAKGATHRDLLLAFVNSPELTELIEFTGDEDYSIKAKFADEARFSAR